MFIELCNCEDDHGDDELDMNDGEENNRDEEHNDDNNLTNQDVVYSLTTNQDLDEDNIDSEAFRSFMETGIYCLNTAAYLKTDALYHNKFDIPLPRTCF